MNYLFSIQPASSHHSRPRARPVLLTAGPGGQARCRGQTPDLLAGPLPSGPTVPRPCACCLPGFLLRLCCADSMTQTASQFPLPPTKHLILPQPPPPTPSNTLPWADGNQHPSSVPCQDQTMCWAPSHNYFPATKSKQATKSKEVYPKDYHHFLCPLHTTPSAPNSHCPDHMLRIQT